MNPLFSKQIAVTNGPFEYKIEGYNSFPIKQLSITWKYFVCKCV